MYKDRSRKYGLLARNFLAYTFIENELVASGSHSVGNSRAVKRAARVVYKFDSMRRQKSVADVLF